MRQRRGYVLLVTLGLLVLSTTLLVAVGRSAARHSAQALLDEQSLQRKWGLATCRAAVLPFAERVLSTVEQNENRVAARVRVNIRLGNDTFALVVADEQAKASVNEMLTRMPASSVEARLRDAMSGTSLFAHVRLRPTAPALFRPPAATQGDVVSPLPPFCGFGQLFDDVSPATLTRAGADSSAPIDLVTCWGDGQLNLLRASREAMRMSLATSLSPLQIDRLIAARDATVAISRSSRPAPAPASIGSPDAVQRLLNQAKIAPTDRAKLPLAARSSCHSLLIELNDGRRFWYDFTVSDESSPRGVRTSSAVW